jgi:hypothetical protein
MKICFTMNISRILTFGIFIFFLMMHVFRQPILSTSFTRKYHVDVFFEFILHKMCMVCFQIDIC